VQAAGEGDSLARQSERHHKSINRRALVTATVIFQPSKGVDAEQFNTKRNHVIFERLI